jgi:hypothetical protein
MQKIIAYLIKKNSVALVRERTIPTERPPPVGVSANSSVKLEPVKILVALNFLECLIVHLARTLVIRYIFIRQIKYIKNFYKVFNILRSNLLPN